MYNLGVMAREAGDLKGAKSWWERAAELGNAKAMSNLGFLARETGDLKGAKSWWERSRMGIFKKSSNLFPVTLMNGTAMNLTLDSPLPDEFVFEEFVVLDSKPLEWTVHDWHPDFVKNLSSQMYLEEYISIAKGVSDSHFVTAPLKISNAKLRLVNTDGVGILGDEALSFFWESKNRINVLILAHTGTRSIRNISHYSFASTNEGAICRRSPAPELVENEEWIFSPSLTNYGKRNLESLQIFFTLQLLQVLRNLNE
jgi:hypothetical protein